MDVSGTAPIDQATLEPLAPVVGMAQEVSVPFKVTRQYQRHLKSAPRSSVNSLGAME